MFSSLQQLKFARLYFHLLKALIGKLTAEGILALSRRVGALQISVIIICSTPPCGPAILPKTKKFKYLQIPTVLHQRANSLSCQVLQYKPCRKMPQMNNQLSHYSLDEQPAFTLCWSKQVSSYLMPSQPNGSYTGTKHSSNEHNSPCKSIFTGQHIFSVTSEEPENQ